MSKDWHPSLTPALMKLIEFHQARKKIAREKMDKKHGGQLHPDRIIELLNRRRK